MSTDFRLRVGRDSARTLISGVIASALAITTGIIIANALGPPGKGEYSAVRILYDGVLSIVGGVGSALIYYLTKGSKQLRALLPSLIRIFIVVCLSIWLGSLLWAALRGINRDLIIFIAVVPACIIISWQPALFVSYDRIKYLNYQNVTLGLITLIGTAVAILLFHSSILGPLTAWMIGLYVIAAVVVAFASKVLKSEPFDGKRVPALELISFSARSSLNSVLSFLNSRIDSILVIALAGVAGFGIYSMATGVAELLYALSQAVATSMSRSIGISNFQTSAAITAKAIRFNTIVVATVSCVIFVAAPYLIDKVYGKSFDPAALPLRILLPGLVMFSSNRIFNAFYTYQLGRPIFSVYLLIAVTMIQAAGCIALIPMLGLAGAAAASTLAYFIATLGQGWYFCKVTGLDSRLLWLPRASDFSQIYEVATVTAKASFSLR